MIVSYFKIKQLAVLFFSLAGQSSVYPRERVHKSWEMISYSRAPLPHTYCSSPSRLDFSPGAPFKPIDVNCIDFHRSFSSDGNR